MCIRGLVWLPLKPKNETGFSPISSNWFKGTINKVLFSGIYFTFAVAIETENEH